MQERGRFISKEDEAEAAAEEKEEWEEEVGGTGIRPSR